jgi:hypothetical protein
MELHVVTKNELGDGDDDDHATVEKRGGGAGVF